MPLPYTRAVLLSATALATPIPAQIDFEPNIGAALTPAGDNDEVVVANLALGFTFRFPDGSLASAADVTVNGRVFPAGLGTSRFSTNVAEFLNGPPAIAAYWRDQQFNTPGAGALHFNALPGKAVFTWVDATEFTSMGFYTYQCQLFADGRIRFVYDERVAVTGGDALVGLSFGNGAPDPGPSDFAAAPSSPIATGGTPTVYEPFTIFGVPGPALPFDLAGFGLEFTPDGAGGWNVTGQLPPNARTERIGVPCEKALQFVPDGSGGYVVVPAFNAWIDNLGASIGPLADDSASSVQNLGFTFAFPGGTTSSQAVATDNGRILIPGTETSFFWPPTPFFLWNRPFPTIAPFWNPLDPGAGGDVLFDSGPGVATFTWQGVVQRGESNALTFQAQLRGDDSITFVLRSTEQFVVNSDTAIVGVSEGGLMLGPGESDFHTLPISGGATIYEFIDSTFSGGESNRYQLGLSALTPPAFGTSFDLRLDGIAPGTGMAWILFGFSNPSAPLGQIPGLGLPGCWLYTDARLPATAVPFNAAQSSVQSFPIPMSSSATGLDLYLQGATSTPGATPLGLVLSNGIRGVVGP